MFSPILIAVVFAVGILIGGVGIGGVLLVPALKYLGSVPLHIAIPACMLGYIVTGMVGAIMYARHGTINWPLAIKICIGALPGAFLGSFILPYVSAFVLELVIGVLILASGINSIIRHRQLVANRMPENNAELISIGVITGIGSALTGTGGPLLLIPLLLWRKAPVLTAIGLSQAVQVPISLAATSGNLIYSTVDFKLGLLLGLILGAGAIFGAKLAHYLPIDMLKKIIAMLLIAVGLLILYKL